MPIVRDLSALPDSARGGAVAIGNFDGVHRGHARIVRKLLERAGEFNGPAVVFTFDPHPVRLLRPEQCPPPLTWTERKAQLLAGFGVHKLVAYPTDRELLGLSAEDFFKRIVVEALQARAMVEGPNFYFGRNRQGDVNTLRDLTEAHGMTLDIVTPIESSGELVSSSRIRKAIATGDVADAAEMLTAPYRIRGLVTHGVGRGAKIGFPTANLAGIDTLLPAPGVYAGRAWHNGISHAAAIHLGGNPTFDEPEQKVEVHLIGREETLYGETLEVEFLHRLRGVEPFPSKDALVAQLREDVAEAKRIALAPTTNRQDED
ncbi:MAG: bifunctional riboflavin kinase/FAD synthetase [Planctomycetota bacterium]